MDLYPILIYACTFASVALFALASYRMLKELQQVPLEEDAIFFGLRGQRAQKNVLYRVTMFVIRFLARLNLSWNLGEYEQGLRRKLDAAGRPLDLKPLEFLALNELSALFCGLVGLGVAFGLPGRVSALVPVLAGTAGFFLPTAYLNSLIRRRQFLLLRDLPFCCDLLTLAAEAGLDFGSALERVVASGPPGPLRDELSLVLQECKLGKTRREALAGLADRVQMQEVSHFVGAIVQADRMGTGFASVLRTQSHQVRARRFERAEKIAQKVPVKILFPIIIANLLSIGVILIVPLLSAIRQVGL